MGKIAVSVHLNKGEIEKLVSIKTGRMMEGAVKSAVTELRRRMPGRTLKSSWEYKRNDNTHYEIYSKNKVVKFLYKGTGVWGERKRPFVVKTPYVWFADMNSIHRYPMIRGINPHKIALAINRDALKRANAMAKRTGRWDIDDYKVASYNFPKIVQDAISSGFKKGMKKYGK